VINKYVYRLPVFENVNHREIKNYKSVLTIYVLLLFCYIVLGLVWVMFGLFLYSTHTVNCLQFGFYVSHN